MDWKNAKVMVVDDGARGELIARRIAASPWVSEVILAPGGIRNSYGVKDKIRREPIAVDKVGELIDFAVKERVGFLVPTCDAPLVGGIVDRAEENGILAFGPSEKLAMMFEGSKAAGCHVAQSAGIPHPQFKAFSNASQAITFARGETPLVVKADGLKRGKGVEICWNLKESEKAIRQRLGVNREEKIVLQQYLEGKEISLQVLSNGSKWRMLPLARDHKHFDPKTKKRVTGGILSFAPVPDITPGTIWKIEQEIVSALFKYLWDNGLTYKGLLYPGLKLTSSGPKVLEWNARFGNPEMVVLRLFPSDLFVTLYRAARGENIGSWVWDQRFVACLVLCSRGYPESDEGWGEQISGLEEASEIPGVEIIPGAVEEKNGKWFTAGGRAVYVTALGDTLDDAIVAAYKAAERIHFAGKQFLPEAEIDK